MSLFVNNKTSMHHILYFALYWGNVMILDLHNLFRTRIDVGSRTRYFNAKQWANNLNLATWYISLFSRLCSTKFSNALSRTGFNLTCSSLQNKIPFIPLSVESPRTSFCSSYVTMSFKPLNCNSHISERWRFMNSATQLNKIKWNQRTTNNEKEQETRIKIYIYF